MAYTVQYSFTLFYEAINLPGDHRALANARRDWIVARLRQSMTVLDAKAIGSIPRYTALRGQSDLDIMVVLHYGHHVKDRSPADVLASVKTALGSGAGEYRRNGQAVTMRFQSWPNVDVVPAARYDSDGVVSWYEIPDMHSGNWLTTKPDDHAAKIRAAASQRGEGFRRVVTMIKHWNRRQDVRLQSYHIEVIALLTECSWDEPGWAILNWFRNASAQMHFCWDGSSDVSAYLTWDRAEKAKQQIDLGDVIALRAWSSTYGDRAEDFAAIVDWRHLLGSEFPAYG